MSRLIKQSVHLAGIVGVIACSALAASAVNHILEARYLGASSEAVLGPTVTPTVTASDHVSARDKRGADNRSKDGAGVIERNMFCSGCVVTDGPPAPERPEDGTVPLTELPLELLATNLAKPVKESFATVRHQESGHQGSFFTGDALPGAGAIERIDGASVTFHNPHTGRIERLSLMSARRAPDTRRRASQPRARAEQSPYADRVRKVDETTYEVERALVDDLLSNPAKLGARVRPVAGKDGSVSFKLYGVRPGSPLSAIGIRNGDAIEAVNGYAMTSNPDKLLEMYTKLSQQQNLSVNIRRRGQPVVLDYRVR